MTVLVSVSTPGDQPARRCRSRSPYGDCGRTGKHAGPHAVPIGDDVWYGYLRGGTPLGYGHLDGDTFTPIGRPPGYPTG